MREPGGDGQRNPGFWADAGDIYNRRDRAGAAPGMVPGRKEERETGRRAKDLSGLERPYFTVLRRIGTMRLCGGKCVKPVWLCRCGCGNEFAATSDVIYSGRRESCGCLHYLDKAEKEVRINDYARKNKTGQPKG